MTECIHAMFNIKLKRKKYAKAYINSIHRITLIFQDIALYVKKHKGFFSIELYCVISQPHVIKGKKLNYEVHKHNSI